MCLKSPKLWIVATPIGNLGDLSFRAKEALSKVDIILAEDTRKAGVFCSTTGVGKKRFISLYEHNEDERTVLVLELLREGKEVALISNAGTPVISDPGYRIVRACRKNGFDVSVVPGPSAPIAALVVSGFPPIPFTFVGFLPRGEGARRELFLKFCSLSTTLIFFERKSRIKKSLQILFDSLGERDVCIARELTKRHEEVIFLNSHKDLDKIGDLKGEITVVVAPSFKEEKTPEKEVEKIVMKMLKDGIAVKQVISKIKDQVKGWSKKELYNLCLKIKSD